MPLLLLFTVHFFASKKMGLLTFVWVALRFSPCGLRYSRILRAGAALALLALVGLRPPSTPVGDAIFFEFFFSQNKIFLTLTFPESYDILKFEHKYINI